MATPTDYHGRPLPADGKRLLVDGVFDVVHFGHFNAFRQARLMGSSVTAAVNEADSVEAMKGKRPVFTDAEREEVLAECVFVDRAVVINYNLYYEEIMEKCQIDSLCHGDDVVINSDGTSPYETWQKLGKFKVFPRTIGVSTTVLTERLLTSGKAFFNGSSSGSAPDEMAQLSMHRTSMHRTMIDSNLVAAFIGDRKPPKATDAVVFIDGAFDLIHVGVVRRLQAAKKLGDYLVVGCYDDLTAYEAYNPAFPVMSSVERALALLALRSVDAVVMCWDGKITSPFIKTHQIGTIVKRTPIDSLPDDDKMYTTLKTELKIVCVEDTLPQQDVYRRTMNSWKNSTKKLEERLQKEARYYKTFGQDSAWEQHLPTITVPETCSTAHNNPSSLPAGKDPA